MNFKTKELQKKHFRNRLILKGAILVGLSRQGGNGGLEKKSGSKLPRSTRSYLHR